MSLKISELTNRYLNEDILLHVFHIVLIVVLGLVAVRLIDLIVRRVFTRTSSEQVKAMLHKTIIYIGWILIFLALLGELGVKLSALLGAAGVVGIAVGIASQKSLGNIISGFFLVSDKTFEVGDVIRVGTNTGVVHSLDLLSIKLRTFDNTLIRIPNEQIISTEIKNITRFPIRRMDFSIRIAYKEDLARVREALLRVAKQNPLCLEEPEPIFLLDEFGDSGIGLLFGIWFEKSNFIEVKNSVFDEIKRTFEAEGIEIPFPHISLYSGSVSKPFPIRSADIP